MNFGYDRIALCACHVVMNTRIEHLIVKFKQLTFGLAGQKIIGIDNFKDKLKRLIKISFSLYAQLLLSIESSVIEI